MLHDSGFRHDAPAEPAFVWVSLPADDEVFREHVADALDALGPDVHRREGGPAALLFEVSDCYPEAGLEPVVMSAGVGRPRQVWWYVHRDGAPAHLA